MKKMMKKRVKSGKVTEVRKKERKKERERKGKEKEPCWEFGQKECGKTH